MIVVTMPWGASLLSEKTLQLEMLLIPQQYLLCQKKNTLLILSLVYCFLLCNQLVVVNHLLKKIGRYFLKVSFKSNHIFLSLSFTWS